MKPLVSVVMASYNHALFVKEAIESVLSQSHQDFELVITDDGSRDRTADVVRTFADPRINFVALAKNEGACVAMNESIRRSQGLYLAVLNSDDAFESDKLRLQLEFLESHPEFGAVFALPAFVNAAGQSLAAAPSVFARSFSAENRSRLEWLRQFFLNGNCLCHPTMMVRRSCYEQIGLYDPLLMQLPDFDQWVRLCRSYELHVMPQKLTRFRVLDAEMNTSAPSLSKMARHAWELETVLSHFAALDDATLRGVLVGESAWAHTDDPQAALAMTALRIGRPGYVQFGARLLRERLRQSPGLIETCDYFSLIGTADPCGAKFDGAMFRSLAESRALYALRNAVRVVRFRLR